MKVLTFGNHKGGVGKTSFSRAVGLELARRSNRVLFVDSDPQGNLTTSLQLPETDGLYSLLLEDADWREVLKVVDAKVYGGGGLVGIVPSSKRSRAVADELVNVFKLDLRLQQVTDMWDYVVIDTPPTPSALHGTIFVATDAVIVPTETESFSINQLVKTLRDIEEANFVRQRARLGELKLLGIIPNRFNQAKSLHKQNYAELVKNFEGLVWSPVAERVAWGEANQNKLALSHYAPKSEANQELQAMVDRIEEVFANVFA